MELIVGLLMTVLTVIALGAGFCVVMVMADCVVRHLDSKDAE